MLNQQQKEKLKANWGDKADSMACKAEVRVYDPTSPWRCYIYAMNPEDENQVCVLVRGFEVETCEMDMRDLQSMFNVEGEGPIVDMEFRPRQVSQLFKLLNEGKL